MAGHQNFVHASEAKGREAPHVRENESDPGHNPSRRRFSTNTGSVAPALRLAARIVLQAVVVVALRHVIDALMK